MLKPPPTTERRIYETLWIDDSAIDIEESKAAIPHWTETGETDGLVMRAGIAPSPIEYRAMTPREVGQLPPLDGDGGSIDAQCYEACRYGLVSVKGVQLRRAKHKGVRGLTDRSLDVLSEYVYSIPAMRLHDRWLRLRGFTLDLRQDEDEPELTTSLAQWIGGLVLEATFRGGRGNP